MFELDLNKCKLKFQEFMDEAREHGNEFKEILRKQEVVINYRRNLKYFQDQSLYQDVRTKLRKLDNYLRQWQELIENEKSYKELSKDGQMIQELIRET